MKKYLFVLIIFFLCLPASPVWSATTNCNGTLSDCQTKMTAASSGDTITIGSSGNSYTWSGAFTMKAGVTLKGFGTTALGVHTAQTTITMSDSIILASNSRVTGINMVDSGSCYDLVTTDTTTSNFRVDNNKMTTSMMAFRMAGAGKGVVDSNEIHCLTDATSCVYVPMENSGTWSAIDFGSAEWLFLEGNAFYNGGAGPDFIETHYSNSKVVQRWNTYHEENGGYYGAILESHNDGDAPSPTTGGGGTRARETYNERVVLSTPGSGLFRRLINIRNGTVLLYNWVVDITAVPTAPFFLSIYNYRTAGGVNHNDNSDGDMCDTHTTSNAWYSGAFTARCCSTAYSASAGGHTVTGEGYSVDAPCLGTGTGVNRTREPLYFWNNRTVNGSTYANITTDHIGLGEETGAWALPLNEMYFVNPNGTSKPTQLSSYTPYTCPHPLTGLTGSCDSAVAGVAGYNVSSGDADTTPPAKPTGLSVS